eukprot:9957267-Heterocapsa_arctica.AAC.1
MRATFESGTVSPDHPGRLGVTRGGLPHSNAADSAGHEAGKYLIDVENYSVTRRRVGYAC